jgi:phosphoglycerol transferase MdoB-like AlkP superfamily enzyme
MFIDLPFFLLLISMFSKNINKKIKLFIIIFVVSLLLMAIQFYVLESEAIIMVPRFEPIVMSPLGNHIYDIYCFIYEKIDLLNDKEIQEIDNWMMENEKYQFPDPKFINLEGIAKGKNIIVVQFESLENIVIGKSYFDQEITPNINRLLNNSIYFNNIYEQVKDGNSSDAELLFNTSIYPLRSGSTFLRFGKNEYVSLPKLLNDQGYTSIAIHGDNKEFWNRDVVFEALDYNKYISEESFIYNNQCGIGIADEDLFLQAATEIEKFDNPYYLFIITLTSHMPFDLPEEMQYLKMPNNDYTSLYLKSINYTDACFGEFYEKMKTAGYLDNSILIIYGDHEGVHKYYETDLPDNNKKVPFIIHIPGIEGIENRKIGGQIDIMPTLAYLIGIDREYYFSAVMGRNLFGKSQGSVLLPTGEIIGQEDDIEHLIKAEDMANLKTRGNYFPVKYKD